MIIKIDLAGIKASTWRENLFRFLGGGVTTVVAGLIAAKWGAAVGGLFLAFPAIFPASVTMVEKHEVQKKREKGLRGEKRGADAAAADATGAALGSIGLMVFAVAIHFGIGRWEPAAVLGGGALVWFLVAFVSWIVRKRRKALARLVVQTRRAQSGSGRR